MRKPGNAWCRTYLDELPPHLVFIACTNKAVDQLQQQLQSRFQVFYFEAVSIADVAAHLVGRGLDHSTARGIAQDAKGDVRAAEADAQTHLDCLAAMAHAA